MVDVIKVKKTYNRFKANRVRAIDNTTLHLEDKGLVAILGNSGSGKTTLLNMVGGLDRPDGGKIIVNGKRMNGLFTGRTDSIRSVSIGYIFQNYHLLDDMTVFDNVAIVLRMLGVRKKKKIAECVNYVLDQVGLYRFRNRPVDTLSGGERQRVGIARALVKNPSIIIADEPTGNLDSRNSLEVMRIIKKISEDKLVILVTHEKELAKFYATRIITVVDGKVTEDRENDHDEELDYRIDGKIYLQDMPESEKISGEGVDVTYYSDSDKKVDLRIAVKNGNIYVQSSSGKVDVIDDRSAIELVDDHYRRISRDEDSGSSFDYSKLDTGKKRLRYHSIFGPVRMMINGFRTVFGYNLIKKILLIGFMLAAGFIMYAVSNSIGITTVTDSEFVEVDPGYVFAETNNNSVERFLRFEESDAVDYIMPGDSKVTLSVDYSGYYYQTNGTRDSFKASMTAKDKLTEADLKAGTLGEGPQDIVIDEQVINGIINDMSGYMIGFRKAEDYIGVEVMIGNTLEPFTITGVCSRQSPCVYIDREMFRDILLYGSSSDFYDPYDKGGTAAGENNEENNCTVTDYGRAPESFKIKRGRLPEEDYEIAVSYDQRYTYALNKQTKLKVNGTQLTVVGYYTVADGEDSSAIYSNANTVFYKYVATSAGLTVMPKDQDEVIGMFGSEEINAYSTYERSKSEYKKQMAEKVKSTLILAAIVTGISLVEIFLMLRASFLSRVKEVGTLRAIGLKRIDVCKMFLGEILAITLLTAPAAFGAVGYVLSGFTNYAYLATRYVMDWRVVAISAAIVLVSNLLAGLLPVIWTVRKTPAQILARTDVD